MSEPIETPVVPVSDSATEADPAADLTAAVSTDIQEAHVPFRATDERASITALDEATIALALSEAVLAAPGVTRLEPTLSTTGLRALYRDGGTDGIKLVIRERTIDVDINVGTSRTHQARRVAHQVHDIIGAVAAAQAAVLGSTTISVLTID